MSAHTLLAPGHTSSEQPFQRARPNRVPAVLRGRLADPAWVRPSVLALLLATALLYLWGLGASGYANSFYSAAAQAGSASWKAMFFGSSDAANSITVDKPPAALWIMALSVRVFGLSSWSVLVPQALEGVAAVGLLYLTVRRTSGPAAGLIAGAVLASTPVAALMFRFNNPDSLLTLLMVAGAYCLIRALETASMRWLALVGVLTGFGFLTKMLQALLVVPAFALVYLLAAPNPVRNRIGQLLAAGAALVVSAGWWIAIVSLIPAADRPYIGGSQHNSILELTLGYNGVGRLTGNETGSVGGGGGNGGQWGATGATRLFGTDMGTQISWLLPSSLLLLVAGLWFTRKAARTDRTRAALLLWGGWLLVTGLVFSYAQGIIHAYYTVALAPAIGGVLAVATTLLWRHRDRLAATGLLAASILVAAAWEFHLLDRTPSWLPWLRHAILMAGAASAVLLVVMSRLARRAGLVVAAVALTAALAGPTAYAVSTARTPHTGSIPSAGPASAGGFGGPGGRFNGQRPGGFAPPPAGQLPGGLPPGGLPPGGFPAGGFPPGQVPGGATGARTGGAGGLLNASTPSAAVVDALQANSSRYAWVAAAVGSNSAAGFQLATEKPVMVIGGFNGSDPSPTLDEFKALVADGKIHYFIGGGLGGGRGPGGSQTGGSNASSQISSWVQSTFTATTVGGVTLYDLTQPAG
ncbi:ArnT family glycosyltransferase [Jatrophihabitans sp.]|jgi:4-amino-4-deoxy-L-arabinose transferase-like glycosyltransferase|uniref:ArnT family glycosyltransferase n=1 Tax=Jatrophihabitans sp. TaxID=1932789 RepID=UPI002EECF858